ncbi:MAG: DUF2752 domain-containing protein [Lachnospiraceae bacterium]|nr:DUF2752 domain-containing protein [Lachnospiraceae bacterium]
MKLNDRKFKDELTKTWFTVGIVVGVLLIAAVPLFIFFGKQIAYGGNQCAFLTLTHLYCPGCGGTRSFYWLLRGHIVRSFAMNPFVPYFFADYFIFMINSVLVKTTKKLGFEGFPVTATVYVGLGILLGSWVIRNIIYVIWGITCI